MITQNQTVLPNVFEQRTKTNDLMELNEIKNIVGNFFEDRNNTKLLKNSNKSNLKQFK